MDSSKQENFQEYLIILHENQMSIKHLTANVEKLSLHLDKMVEKQVEMLIQHKELQVVKGELAAANNKINKSESIINDRIEKLEKMTNSKVDKIEKVQGWVAKTLAGGVVSIIVAIVVFSIKGS